jgi:hypothetical protein
MPARYWTARSLSLSWPLCAVSWTTYGKRGGGPSGCWRPGEIPQAANRVVGGVYLKPGCLCRARLVSVTGENHP